MTAAAAPASRSWNGRRARWAATIIQAGTRGHDASRARTTTAAPSRPGSSSSRSRASASTASTSRRRPRPPARPASSWPRARGIPAGCDGVTIIAVDDPRRAMGDVARAARAEFTGLVVGVTGSNGKTTTKELCAAALGPLGAVCRTAGKLQHRRRPAADHPVRDRERGSLGAGDGDARARGDRLPGRGRAPAHRRRSPTSAPRTSSACGSLEDIARAKGELFAGLGPDGWAVLPGERSADHRRRPRTCRADRRLTFGGRVGAATCACSRSFPAGAQRRRRPLRVRCDVPLVVRLPLAGAHNARERRRGAGGGAGGRRRAGRPPRRRWRTSRCRRTDPRWCAAGGRTILDDCYNANPASMSAAIATVVAAVGGAGGWARAFAVLGDMLEVGPRVGGAAPRAGPRGGRPPRRRRRAGRRSPARSRTARARPASPRERDAGRGLAGGSGRGRSRHGRRPATGSS